MPKTIWIRRRNPPEVSPKASVRPVTMMMITAMILATGPSIELEDRLQRRLPGHGRACRPGRSGQHQGDGGVGDGMGGLRAQPVKGSGHEESPVVVSIPVGSAAGVMR